MKNIKQSQLEKSLERDWREKGRIAIVIYILHLWFGRICHKGINMQTRFITLRHRELSWGGKRAKKRQRNWYPSNGFNVGIWFNTLNIIKVINHLESRLLYALVIWFSLDLCIQYFASKELYFHCSRLLKKRLHNSMKPTRVSIEERRKRKRIIINARAP